jgi:hypothetical protein
MMILQTRRLRSPLRRTAGLAVLLGAIVAACAQWDIPASRAADQPAATVDTSGAGLPATVSGSFLRGHQGLWNESLEIRADGTFTRSFHGDTVGPSGGGSGGTSTVSREGSFLILKDERAPNEPSADGIRPMDRFLIVPWDQRLYLVPDLMIPDFCNAVNNGEEPRSRELASYFFVKSGQCAAPARGRPTLPREWSSYILPRELQGRTSAPDADGTTWVSFGSAEGLLPGMEPVLKQLPSPPEAIARGAPRFRDQPLEIVELQEHRCRVQYKWARDRRPPIPQDLDVVIGQTLSGSP